MGQRCYYFDYYNYNEATVGLFFVYFDEILQQHLQPTKRPLLHRSLYQALPKQASLPASLRDWWPDLVEPGAAPCLLEGDPEFEVILPQASLTRPLILGPLY